MAKFRVKELDVEATQWLKPGDHPKVKAMPGDLDYPPGTESRLDGQVVGFLGEDLVRPGDWIVERPWQTMRVTADKFAEHYVALE